MKCSKCGAELSDDTKFCSYCGQRIEHANETVPETPLENEHYAPSEGYGTHSSENEVPPNKISTSDRTKDEGAELWNKLSVFGKISTIAIGLFVLLCLVAFLAGKTFAGIISLVQISMVVVALLMYKGIISSPKSWLKYILLAAAILFTVLNVMSYSWGGKKPLSPSNSPSSLSPQTTSQPAQVPAQPIQTPYETASSETTYFSIEKASEYAYMSDEWNVYIATAISDSIIKIENWGKTLSSTKSVDYKYDVRTYKINESENGFSWIDDEHTAFCFSLQDKSNSRLKTSRTVVFTINISDSDKYKGSDYDEQISCYSFQNDDWHLYRAIPLTEALVKIETWSRSSSAGSFVYGYDVCVIDTENTRTDFAWTDDERTSFTITMRDVENDYYWKSETFEAFTLENENYIFKDVKSYLDSFVVGEDEVAVPASASSYKYDAYQDVQEDLISAGFTNISTEILYDIVFGWTSEGEVKSVSIDGRTDYEQGDVFKKDTPIVITYHMKEEDDPAKQNNESSEVPSAVPSEMPTNTAQTDAVSYSTNDQDTAKKGNSGVFSYKSRGGTYDIYYIIDFDEGYVYYFCDGNGDTTCDRLKIDSGDLNDVLIITYHDGSDVWSYGLHFKWKNQPDHLIVQDNDGFEYDFFTTTLSNALSLQKSKTIVDY